MLYYIIMKRLIKRSSSIAIFAFFILLVLLNVIPLYIILAGLLSPYRGLGLAGLAFPYLWPFFLLLAAIDISSGIGLIITKRHITASWKTICYVTLLFATLHAGLGVLGLYWKISGTPNQISGDDAIALVGGCDVTSVIWEPYKDPIFPWEESESLLHTDRQDYNIDDLNRKKPLGFRLVAESNFDAIIESARSVQERCNYEFNFGKGTNGFSRKDNWMDITLNEAADLVRNCAIEDVQYTDMNYSSVGIPTGIELWTKANPQHINVRKELKDETSTIFSEARKSCPTVKIMEL